ncbi:hypothetical protein [Paenibacillus antarcticus]|nr:hypothetical protein [Paenibacillus antarcticus]
MCNFKVMRYRIPTMDEIVIKTGRSVKDLTSALTELEQQRYIYWEDKTKLSGIVILEDEDRDGVTPPSPPLIQNDITYWTS